MYWCQVREFELMISYIEITKCYIDSEIKVRKRERDLMFKREVCMQRVSRGVPTIWVHATCLCVIFKQATLFFVSRRLQQQQKTNATTISRDSNSCIFFTRIIDKISSLHC